LRKPLDVEEPVMVGPKDAYALPEGDINPQKMTFWGWFWGSMAGDYPYYNPAASRSVPLFWSSERADRPPPWKPYILEDPPLFLECLVGAIFGAIHCAAWHTAFPTHQERWMWRVCALVVTVLPFFTIGMTNRGLQSLLSSSPPPTVFVFSIYTIAHIILVISAFTACRALPPGTFIDINWSVYIPHL
jgi:hypothetical protein